MSKGINPELVVGDRIVILHMSEEPFSVPIGTKGEVMGITQTPWGIQYQVNWDNGSKLDIIPGEDFWKKEKNKIQENMLDDLKKKREGLKVFDYFNKPEDILNFMFKLKESGIANMFDMSYFLLMDENTLRRWLIGRYSDEEIEDKYEELLETVEPMRNQLIYGLMNYMEKNNKSVEDLDLVNNEFKKFARMISNTYVRSYNELKSRYSSLM
jgi:hypothetical protein